GRPPIRRLRDLRRRLRGRHAEPRRRVAPSRGTRCRTRRGALRERRQRRKDLEDHVPSEIVVILGTGGADAVFGLTLLGLVLGRLDEQRLRRSHLTSERQTSHVWLSVFG